MTRSLRRGSLGWIALLAALGAVTMILVGCGSPATVEQEGRGVGAGPAEVAEEGAIREGTAAELALGESAPSEARSAQVVPRAEEVPSGKPAAESTGPLEAAPATAAAVDWVGSAQKWVPIFSLETEGVYLGAAQVAGPSSQVEKVKGAAEVRLNFKNIGRIYAYVPVSTINLTKLNRVQGVSVWAIGDLQLAEF